MSDSSALCSLTSVLPRVFPKRRWEYIVLNAYLRRSEPKDLKRRIVIQGNYQSLLCLSGMPKIGLDLYGYSVSASCFQICSVGIRSTSLSIIIVILLLAYESTCLELFDHEYYLSFLCIMISFNVIDFTDRFNPLVPCNRTPPRGAASNAIFTNSYKDAGSRSFIILSN